MGRNSGGVRGGKGTGRNNSGKGSTEDGYTSKMVKNILGMENRIRQNRNESLHVFDSKGNLIESIGGKGAEVSYKGHRIPQNSILTHNHPKSLGARGIRRIGNSFSIEDIVSAVSLNAAEIRAVTPTYTFSLKRPKGVEGAHLVKRKGESDEEEFDIAIDGFFLAIGHKPNTELFKDYIDLDEQGFIKVVPGTTSTNVPGVFAAGDVADPVYRQGIVAAGSGAKAAIEADRYLQQL